MTKPTTNMTRKRKPKSAERDALIATIKATHDELIKPTHVAQSDQVQQSVENGFLIVSHNGPWVRLKQFNDNGTETARVINVGPPEGKTPPPPPEVKAREVEEVTPAETSDASADQTTNQTDNNKAE